MFQGRQIDPENLVCYALHYILLAVCAPPRCDRDVAILILPCEARPKTVFGRLFQLYRNEEPIPPINTSVG